MGSSGFSRTVVDVLEAAVPGPAGQLLTSAARQAQEAGSSHQYTALIIGLVASLITGTTAFGQFERSCNRIYGVEQDRPSTKKYARAFLLAVTVGVVASLGVTMLVLGRPIAQAIEDSWAGDVWLVVRWPLAVVLLVLATTAMLRWSPNRRQPGLHLARLRCRGLGTAHGRCLRCAGAVLPVEHHLRRHLRSAGRHDRPAALVLRGRGCRPLRDRHHGTAGVRAGQRGADRRAGPCVRRLELTRVTLRTILKQ